MGGYYKHVKRYENHFGLDLKSTDLNRLPDFATSILNAQYRKSGGIEKRPGYQAHASTGVGYGLFTYNKIDPATGDSEAEVIGVGQGASRLLFTSLTIAYGGADTTAVLNQFYDTEDEEYKCQILVGDTNVLDQSLGIGFDEASPVTITDLATAINLVADLTATVSGDGSVPAAFLGICRDHDLAATGTSKVLTAAYWQAINTTATNPFATFYAARNDDDFEIMSGIQIDNVLYLSGGGEDYVHKYDGQTLYRAGIPALASVAAAIGSATGITGSNYLYAARAVQYDAAGNIIEGNIIFTANPLSPANEKVNVTVANVLAGTGFNTNCALVNGNQVAVTTITVTNSPHTMQVGDTAYFLDRTTGNYVERLVTARGNTTVTIAGAAVDVNSGDVISNNLRIALYRSKTSGTTPSVWYSLKELPNNSFSATQVYVDAIADASLGAQLIEPVTDRSLPPKMKYISVFQGQMVGGGVRLTPNTLYWSDVDGPEYFPDGDNSQNLDTVAGDVISGVAPNNEILAVTKKKSICTMSGELADNKVRFDWLTHDVGCVAHATLKEVQGELCWMSDRGPYRMVSGQIPRPLGETKNGGGRLEPIADQQGVPEEQQLNFQRAVAINHREAQKYIIYFPAESETGGANYSNSNSVLYVWDYAKGMATGAWLQWDNMDLSGGAVTFDGEFYFQERRYSDFASAVHHVLYRRLNLNDAWDYQDNNTFVDWEYAGGWETLGEASTFKKWLRLRVFQAEETPNNDQALRVQTEVNFVRDSTISDFDLEASGSGYGTGEYGTPPMGDPSESRFDHKLSGGRFYAMRMKFINQEPQQNVHVTAWEMEVAAPFKPGFKG